VLAAVVGWACVVARVLAFRTGVRAARLQVVGTDLAVGVGLASPSAPLVVPMDRMAHRLSRVVMDWRWFVQGRRSVPQSYLVRGAGDVDEEYERRRSRWERQSAGLPAPRIVDVADAPPVGVDEVVKRFADLSADLGWPLEPWQCNAARAILSVGQTMRHYELK